MASSLTVKHYNVITGLWHVEEASDGSVWVEDAPGVAADLADGYRDLGFEAYAVEASELTLGRSPAGGLVVA